MCSTRSCKIAKSLVFESPQAEKSNPKITNIPYWSTYKKIPYDFVLVDILIYHHPLTIHWFLLTIHWCCELWNNKSLIILVHLILVQFTAFEFLFSFALKRDDHKTDEDVDHEESNDDDVNYIVDCYPWSVVLKRTFINFSWVDGVLQDAAEQRSEKHF